MSFARAGRPHEDDILFLVDELEVEERQDVCLVDGFWEVEVKSVEKSNKKNRNRKLQIKQRTSLRCTFG